MFREIQLTIFTFRNMLGNPLRPSDAILDSLLNLEPKIDCARNIIYLEFTLKLSKV